MEDVVEEMRRKRQDHLLDVAAQGRNRGALGVSDLFRLCRPL